MRTAESFDSEMKAFCELELRERARLVARTATLEARPSQRLNVKAATPTSRYERTEFRGSAPSASIH
jgi:hypothetical protein